LFQDERLGLDNRTRNYRVALGECLCRYHDRSKIGIAERTGIFRQQSARFVEREITWSDSKFHGGSRDY